MLLSLSETLAAICVPTPNKSELASMRHPKINGFAFPCQALPCSTQSRNAAMGAEIGFRSEKELLKL